ncbi:hypothetical protein [Rhodoferax sp. GW822-FHT02A01]|uniref:hypothetical protein n=1 Tax=Rhodoferax sp. GW822-FHT02A01 TaxID=3141537 RepID=UPI00315DE16F
MSWSIIWSPDLALVRFTGITSVEDLVAANNACHGDHRFDGLKVIVLDFLPIDAFLGLEKLSTCVEDVWVVDYGSKQSNAKVQKFVVTNNSMVKAFVEEYRNLPEQGTPIRLYERLEEAIADARKLVSGQILGEFGP